MEKEVRIHEDKDLPRIKDEEMKIAAWKSPNELNDINSLTSPHPLLNTSQMARKSAPNDKYTKLDI